MTMGDNDWMRTVSNVMDEDIGWWGPFPPVVILLNIIDYKRIPIDIIIDHYYNYYHFCNTLLFIIAFVIIYYINLY